ncbi:MAG: restriction endonuclease subunit S [Sedimenticola sp.]|mgnify:CR=1 FL=1|nr:MAG: restriction endonuclease subunit S [Sedimenticola sp.]
MLDSETKRRIDTCRDILVGKVPDPKSQVEQITIALIYKFMDDMDAEAEELGGERSFFTGEFARYGWSKLMAPGLGGHEMLSLYAEAIQRMNENPGIPALFRDIFKNAFLPYRDPETLRSFLKEINTFTYDHSERLGDAFEYLLSVLGSQGEAGQFRTPRHIIDFMVEIIDPKKDETILDPACGTAGFLISAYKHILKHNSTGYQEQQDREAYDEQGVPMEALTLESPLRYSGDLLTPDDRKRLATNIGGYDISPDMVRLSLVNMYLHGFIDPHIEEYDTLTSDEKWPELADVILANPPFMSPKGGIRPHNRFAVQSKRSEVLFVDYIAEHLTPNGRAAIVVPEGIIFQSQGAYRQLREMLVKGYLAAVISLPAGVFNPYSGVKTSILVLDKRLAKQRDEVLFVKIDNDGFNLGAQRRPIDKNDLPEAVRTVKAFLQQGEVAERKNVLAVSRERIGENGEWNLSGERYATGIEQLSQYEMVSLGDVANLYQPKTITSKEILEDGPYKVFGANGIIGYFTEYNHEAPEVLITCRGATCGTVNMSEAHSWVTGNAMVAQPKDDRLDKIFLFYFLKNTDLSSVISGAAQPQITRQSLAPFQIPLPPLEVQKEIVAEIEGYQKIIDGARQVVENYQPRIPVHPDWPMVELGEHFSTSGGGTPSKSKPDYWAGDIPWVSPKDMKADVITDTEDHISEAAIEGSSTKLYPAGTIVCVVRSGILKHSFPVAILSRPMCINQDLLAFKPKDDGIVSKFLFYVLKSKSTKILEEGIKPGVTVQSFYNGFFKSYKVPLPDSDTQQAIVEEIEHEQSLADANKELIHRFEEKIKQTINRVWGEAE